MSANTLKTVLDLSGIQQDIGGYSSLYGGAIDDAPDTTTDDYASAQEQVNAGKVLAYLLPRLRACNAHSVLDVGCGVGAMVRTLLSEGFDAYGVDLPGLHRHWTRLGLPSRQMYVVDPGQLRLPFVDGGLDFVCTFGVIEHVGTTDGNADRAPGYHDKRKQWLRELFRVVRPGGAMLIGGPNRRFPVDVAHGLDSRASSFERWLSAKAKVSIHKTWGENFLWAYPDLDRYLAGLSYSIEPQRLAGFLSCSRVPGVVRPLVQGYVDRLPAPLLGTAFNPWVMALVHKPAN